MRGEENRGVGIGGGRIAVTTRTKIGIELITYSQGLSGEAFTHIDAAS
jgi:hypothetical protein